MNENSNIQQKIIELEREVRDLKTGKAIPSTINFYRETLNISGTYTDLEVTVNYGTNVYGTIPLLFTWPDGQIMTPYDSTTNTQKLIFQGQWTFNTPVIVISNLSIDGLTY